MTVPAVRSITLRVGDENPPSGVIVAEGGAEIPFTGWLGMLQALSDLLSATPKQSATRQQEVYPT